MYSIVDIMGQVDKALADEEKERLQKILQKSMADVKNDIRYGEISPYQYMTEC